MIALPPPHPVQIPLTPEQQVLVNLNHELRTPLQTVLVRLEQVLRSPQLTSEDYQSLQHANAATQHMVHVVREFLQFSSETIKPAHPESASEVVELAVLLNTLVQIYTLHAKDHGLSCHFVASATLPSHIQVSERLLRQVLTALLENAIRYTHTGGITLRVRSQLPLHDGINTPQTGLLRFEVEDTGIGLTPADRARVFEPFCQLATSPEKRSGLGLGLTLSRHAVMQMGGELQVASFPGQGSIFWFEIPVQIVLPRPVVLDAREQELDPHLLLPQPEYLTPLYRAACRGDVTQVTAQAQALAQRDSRYDEFVTQVLWLIAQQPAAAGAIAQWLEPYVALR
ncbi:MAG: sensor histidine kinase [Spirulinaceae cyanobacterium]